MRVGEPWRYGDRSLAGGGSYHGAIFAGFPGWSTSLIVEPQLSFSALSASASWLRGCRAGHGLTLRSLLSAFSEDAIVAGVACITWGFAEVAESPDLPAMAGTKARSACL